MVVLRLVVVRVSVYVFLLLLGVCVCCWYAVGRFCSLWGMLACVVAVAEHGVGVD